MRNTALLIKSLSALVSAMLVTSCKAEKLENLSVSPGKPLDITISDIDEATLSAQISWSEPIDPGVLDDGNPATITEYVVEYSTDYFENLETKKSTESTTTLDNLLGNGTTYFVRIYARNNSDSFIRRYSQSKSFMVGSIPPPN